AWKSATTRRDENEQTSRGRKRCRTPHPEGAHCIRGRPGASPVFLPCVSARWSVRESNPLRRALQAPALPIELTDRTKHTHAAVTQPRKAEDSNLTQQAARIAFQAISAPDGFAFH